MKKSFAKSLRGSLILVLTALIWGTAFVAQSVGVDFVRPFTYNGVRSILGGIVLLPVSLLSYYGSRKRGQHVSLKNTIIGGIAAGCVLCIASTLQQFGISSTSVGKAGFITALYIVIVPVLGLFLRKKIPYITWACVAVATVGFYLLCIKENFSVGLGDLFVLACSFFFSVHILTIDFFLDRSVSPVLMSCIQFLTCGLISLPFIIFMEKPNFSMLSSAALPIAYGGIMSCGVAYTLQIIGQRDCPPVASTLIMSLEAVFAALAGWAILKEGLMPRELAGCFLVFVAVITVQMPNIAKSKK